MKRPQSVVTIVCTVSVLFLGISAIQQKLTSMKRDAWFTERMSYLPKSEALKPYLLGFSSTYANYLWIKTILYFGTHYESDRDYTWLVTMVDIVTKLNPYFYPAYEFAGVMLPNYCQAPDAARIILQRGLTHLGISKYSIPFYLGWIYYEQYNDYGQAAQYLALASHNPKAPPFYSALAASLYTDAGKRDHAVEFLYSAYYASENPAVKQTVRNKIEELGGKIR